MSSNQHSEVILITFFRALTFGPLIVVSVIILLASLLKILDAFSSLSSRIAEDRALRGIDMTIARSMENGMIQIRVVEDGNDEEAGSRPEEVPVPSNEFNDERVWWTLF